MKQTAARLASIAGIHASRFVFTLLALGTVVMVPLLSKEQLITGSIVNATLLLTTLVAGPLAAIMVGVVPSMVAVSTGTLPIVLAPMVPFIMMANALYVYSFYVISKKHLLIGLASAAVIKAGFLFLMSRALTAPLLYMMTWPQLVTAGMGGLLALLFIYRYRR
jgi:hypothetical protein